MSSILTIGTSLCGPDPVRDFRTHILSHSENRSRPVMILLATDGYANSFVTEADFLKVGADLQKIIRKQGLDSVASQLDGWLNETSQQGSGDDITLGLICSSILLEECKT